MTSGPSGTSGRSIDHASRHQTVGVAQAVGAYLWWGVVTGVYFKSLDAVAPLELLAWRVLAGLPVMLVLLALPPGFKRVRAAISDGRTRTILIASTGLIAVNWFVFIYSVVSSRLVEASLGYYINPLVSVLLGRVFLGERLRPLQLAAVGIAAAGVTVFAWSTFQNAMSAPAIDGEDPTAWWIRLPWISLALPISFGCYGLLRKRMSADSITGLSIEMALLLPLMLGLQLWLASKGETSFLSVDRKTDLLLLAGGVVTAVPLVLFAAAARRLRLATIGLLQYLSPSFQLVLAIVWFGESIDGTRLIAFGFIWLAVAIYSADSIRAHRRPIVSPELDA